MTIPHLYLAADIATVNRWSATRLLERCGRAIQRRGRARLVLAGGNTPLAMYRLLAASSPNAFRWDLVEFYFGDERAVPFSSEASNYGQADRALFQPLGIGPEQIHPIDAGRLGTIEAAANYEALLRNRLTSPDGGFDLVMLGLGDDGHSASLFPGDQALDETDHWALPVEAPPEYSLRARVTLTTVALNLSDEILLVVTGATKKSAVATLLAGDPRLPAARLTPREPGGLGLLIDRNALPDATGSYPDATVLP